MGNFQRSGGFEDREKFIVGLKEKLQELRTGGLAGMSEEWTKEGEVDVGTLSGFGVNVRFQVREQDWDCSAELPSWLPIPQSKVEEMFDGMLKDL